jgi:putative metallopeptidase DUF4344
VHYAVASLAASALLSALVSPGAAQGPVVPVNPQIEISYVEPKNPDLRPVYQHLKNRRVLETLQQFLAPLKLNRKVLVKFDQCGATTVRYKPQGPVTICYEYVAEVERLAPRETVSLVAGPVTTESAIVGPVVQAALREVTIAAFDILQIPVWGRQEDAADRVAAFTMLQFGPDVAWNTVVGFQWFLSGNALAAPDFADVRGAVVQRYYTTLCIAVGAEQRQIFQFAPNDQRHFLWFVAQGNVGDLPYARYTSCVEEFDTVRQAFNQSIMPHLDPALLEQVRKTNWVQFSAAKQ